MSASATQGGHKNEAHQSCSIYMILLCRLIIIQMKSDTMRHFVTCICAVMTRRNKECHGSFISSCIKLS